MSICKVNTAGVTPELQIICGAPNVRLGQKVVLGVAGAVVPATGVRLERRIIRDCYSEGMICSSLELELGDDHDGILVLPEDAPVGLSISEYLGLDDTILDISLTPNKSDCASHLGIAREISAYMRKLLKSSVYENIKNLPAADLYNSTQNIVDIK